MWGALRARRLGGFKFVRQAPIDRHVVDCLCRERRIVVEIDGGTHGSAAEIARDRERTTCLEALGYRVLRAVTWTSTSASTSFFRRCWRCVRAK